MMNNLLIDTIKSAIKDLYKQDIPDNLIQLQKTKKEFDGDVTLVVFPFLKISGKSAETTAEDIGSYLSKNLNILARYNVVKGFLNISYTDGYWLIQLQNCLQPDYLKFTSTGKTYLVEYSSPNTNKPLHLGHLRNIFLGYSVSELLKATGHTVIKTQIINDRGIHICKSMLAWQKAGGTETPALAAMKGDKLVGKYYVAFDKLYKTQIDELVQQGMSKEEAEKNAPAILEAQQMLRKWENNDLPTIDLWKTMNQWVYDGFNETYKKLNVDFDKLYYESDTYLLGKQVVEEGLQKGVFYKKSDGSVWIDLSKDGLDEKLLLRADGTSVYITQDIGTAILRYKDYPNVNGMIYTVGNEQDYHFKVLFTILKKLGYNWAQECYHLSYGMIDLPTGKMKSREGTVVDADDLIDEMIAEAEKKTMELGKADEIHPAEREKLYACIGLGALKYYILKVDPKKRMLFNPEESIDLQGNTGPFIQYTHARIKSLLRKANYLQISIDTTLNLVPEEIEIIKSISEYKSVLHEAAKQYSPALLANYLYELVKTFNHFYQAIPILKETENKLKDTRIALCMATARVISHGLNLLGIEAPEKM
jgi:arginyl-tRNA synthetase